MHLCHYTPSILHAFKRHSAAAFLHPRRAALPAELLGEDALGAEGEEDGGAGHKAQQEGPGALQGPT